MKAGVFSVLFMLYPQGLGKYPANSKRTIHVAVNKGIPHHGGAHSLVPQQTQTITG